MNISSFFKNINTVLSQELVNANSQIKIAVAWFTNTQLFDILCKKLEEKVNVQLIIINDFINNNGIDNPDWQKFIDLGGVFYFGNSEHLMHHKFCIIDNKTLINGSYNWTYFAENKNHENIIIIKENQDVIENFTNEFNKIKDSLVHIKTIEKPEIVSYNQNDFFSYKNLLLTDLNYKSKSQISNKNYSNALLTIESIIKLNPSDNKSLRLRANIKTRLDDFSGALKDTKALSKDVIKEEQKKYSEAQIWYRKGKKEYNEREHEKAILSMTNAIELNPIYTLAYIFRARAKWKISDFKGQLEDANKALEINPNSSQALKTRGNAYYELKQYNNALIDFNNALVITPNDYTTTFNRANVYSKINEQNKSKIDFQKTLNLLNEFLKSNPNEAEGFALRGDCHHFLKNKKNAKEDYLTAKKIIENSNSEIADKHTLDRANSGLKNV